MANGIIGSNDWFPTLVAAAGDPNITTELLKGKQIGNRTYKVHLDGYDQTAVITGKEPSARHQLWYLAGPKLAAVRIDNWKYQFLAQPTGWFGPKVSLDWPSIYNLRLDPFERCSLSECPPQMYDFYAHEFWRFVYAQTGGRPARANSCRVPADAGIRKLESHTSKRGDRRNNQKGSGRRVRSIKTRTERGATRRNLT